jgi:hypothetical protein
MTVDEIRLAILNADDRKLIPVEVPEWNRTIYIKPMSGAERDSFEGETLKLKDRMANFRARTVVRVACNQDGTRLFQDSDAEALSAKSGVALDRVWTVAQGLARLGGAEVEAAGKPSASDQSGASGSSSPATSG